MPINRQKKQNTPLLEKKITTANGLGQLPMASKSIQMPNPTLYQILKLAVKLLKLFDWLP